MSRWEFLGEQRQSLRRGTLSSKCRIYIFSRSSWSCWIKVEGWLFYWWGWAEALQWSWQQGIHGLYENESGCRDYSVYERNAMSFSGFSDERSNSSRAGERSQRGRGACWHGGSQVGMKNSILEQFIPLTPNNSNAHYNTVIVASTQRRGVCEREGCGEAFPGVGECSWIHCTCSCPSCCWCLPWPKTGKS